MKKERLTLFIILTALLFGCQENEARQTESKSVKEPSIMLLGVYHFNNPGTDSYNVNIDDYFSDNRQEEIRTVVDALNNFKPTKIYVEVSTKQQEQLDSLYYLYVNNQINPSDIKNGINEVYQIGFRLGKSLDGVEIQAIDYPGVWLGDYVDFIADTLALDYYQKKQSEEQRYINEKQERLVSNTVKENLIYLNEEQQIIKNHDYYNNVAIRVKDTSSIMFSYQESEQEIDGLPYQMRSYDFNNIGIELVAEWYKRNLFIYRNILENTQANDRVIVIIGSGHVFYLKQLLSNNPNFHIIMPNELLTGKENNK